MLDTNNASGYMTAVDFLQEWWTVKKFFKHDYRQKKELTVEKN